MNRSIKRERIQLQRLALLLELNEDDGRHVPMPVLIDLQNLVRDINIKTVGHPNV